MSRVSQKAVVSAIKSVSAMDLRQKEALADELFRAQPNMFGSVLVLQRMGVSPEKMDFALNLLFICFQGYSDTGGLRQCAITNMNVVQCAANLV